MSGRQQGNATQTSNEQLHQSFVKQLIAQHERIRHYRETQKRTWQRLETYSGTSRSHVNLEEEGSPVFTLRTRTRG